MGLKSQTPKAQAQPEDPRPKAWAECTLPPEETNRPSALVPLESMTVLCVIVIVQWYRVFVLWYHAILP